MIYFWKINRLKSDLVNKSIPRQQVLLYLLCILIIQIAAFVFVLRMEDALNIWDHIDSGVFIIFLIFGTVYCYYANGGPRGQAFVERYVSLAWVFGIRYALLFVIPINIALYTILSFFIEIPEESQWFETLFNSSLKFPFYFILATHIRDVALNRVVSDKESPDLDHFLSNKNTEDFDQSRYPTILRRYMATFIDGTLIFIAFVFFAYLLQGDGGIRLAMRILIGCAILFIYEPLFTSKFCTVGQKAMGIRIRQINSNQKISIIAAYIRLVVKILLGIISFFSIPLTKKRRALHDFTAGSVAVYAG